MVQKNHRENIVLTTPKKVLRTHLLIGLAAATAFGQAHAQLDNYQGYQQPKPSFFEQFVLPAVGMALGGVFGNFVGSLGGKLVSSLLSGPNPPPPQQQQYSSNQQQPQPAAPSYQQPAQYNIPANSAGMMNAVYAPAPPPIPQNGSIVTGVMYVIDRLNSDYSIAETVSPQLGVAPTFQSREKFAIRYTSNLPGVVVIMNVDALQKTFYLGTFVVQPGVEMRFPEQRNKGMVLDDNVGLETYQMLFMACLPPQMANQPDVMARKGLIPECGTTAQAEQAVLFAQRGRKAKGTYNEVLQQADGTRNVVLSAAPYEKGDVTTTTFTINHVVPVGQQQPSQWKPVPTLPAAQPQTSGSI